MLRHIARNVSAIKKKIQKQQQKNKYRFPYLQYCKVSLTDQNNHPKKCGIASAVKFLFLYQ